MKSKDGLDAVERQIILILQENGRTPTAEIARVVGVTEPTIRRKLNRLLEDGVISIRAVSFPERIGFLAPAYIGLDVDRTHIEDVARKLCAYPMVEDVVILTGPYDILIRASFDSTAELYEFVMHELGHLEGIRDSHSLLVLKHLKHGDLHGLGRESEDG